MADGTPRAVRGRRGSRTRDVVVPPWSGRVPEPFRVHRAALEQAEVPGQLVALGVVSRIAGDQGPGQQHRSVDQAQLDRDAWCHLGRTVRGDVRQHLRPVGRADDQPGGGATEGRHDDDGSPAGGGGDDDRLRPHQDRDVGAVRGSGAIGHEQLVTDPHLAGRFRAGRQPVHLPDEFRDKGGSGRSYSVAGAAHRSRRPSRMTPTRSATDSASSWS